MPTVVNLSVRYSVVVEFLAPLDRLAVRRISSRLLFQDERVGIADLRRPGLSLRAIATRLARLPSTISGDSPSFCFGGGARNRSAAICATAFPDDPSTRRVMQAHIGLSTNRIRAFIDLLGLGVTLPPAATHRPRSPASAPPTAASAGLLPAADAQHLRPAASLRLTGLKRAIGRGTRSSVAPISRRSHPRRTQNPGVRCGHLLRRRHRLPAHRPGWRSGPITSEADVVDHLGSGHRDGTPSHLV
ncbi:MAG: helix-turn-helix domain-containing protein [Mycobacterium sp.]